MEKRNANTAIDVINLKWRKRKTAYGVIDTSIINGMEITIESDTKGIYIDKNEATLESSDHQSHTNIEL